MTASQFPSDVAFTPAVKALQTAKGSRAAYARMEETGGWETTVTPDLEAFLARIRSAFLATANADGQPYIQHRGGPPGFIRKVDDRTLGFADFAGNRQYISTANLSENDQAHLFLIDYEQRRRVKIWGRARMVEDDPALLRALTPTDYKARPERVFLLDLVAWDVNCPQHIPQRFEAEDVERALADRDAKIAALETHIRQLTGGQDPQEG